MTKDQYLLPTRIMRSFLQVLLMCAVFLISGCSGGRSTTQEPVEVAPEVSQEEAVLDNVVEENIVETEQSEPQIFYDNRSKFKEPVSDVDVIHSILDISFDFPKQQVIGTAIHRMQVVSELVNELEFNAKDMEIHSVLVKKRHSKVRVAIISVR